MMMVEERDDVVVSGAQSVGAFTIKASAKAFLVLSQNLYSNPVGSMIRELSTNAYDAHIMVNKADVPFVITMPNSLDPSFKIRDYGPGLSEDQIMNIYTTFFESTKTNSNDMVGCLGLGSKSPFAVADSFTITSYHQGIKTIYSAFLNDSRIPSIAKFAQMETDQENGLEIEVAIKADNFRTFAKELNNQLKYFKVKPTILGQAGFEWSPDEEYLYQGTGWKMVRNGSGPRVVQGQIQYPINVRDMGKTYENASPAVQELLNRSVLFEVPIGQVNIAPSREALSYDERTSANIVQAANNILKELPIKLREEIQSAKCEYEARHLYHTLLNDLNRGGYHRSALNKAVQDSGQITWNGIDVSSTSIELEESSLVSLVKFTKNYRGRFQRNVGVKYRGSNNQASHWEFQVTDMKGTVWIYSTPQDKAVESRAKQHVDSMNSSTVLNILCTTLSPEKIASELGLNTSDLVLASTLPKVQRVKSGTTAASKTDTINRYVDAYRKSLQWKNETVTNMQNLTGFYVDLERFDVVDNNGRNVSDFRMMIQAAIELKLISSTDVIYGLRPTQKKKPNKLVNLFTHMQNKAHTVQVNSGQKYNFGDSSYFVNKMTTNMEQAKKVFALISSESPAKVVLQAIVSDTVKTSSYYHVTDLINRLKVDVKTNQTDLSAQAIQMDKMYPMLQNISYYFDSDAVATYIMQMDTLAKLNLK
jgi:hypothetical protein